MVRSFRCAGFAVACSKAGLILLVALGTMLNCSLENTDSAEARKNYNKVCAKRIRGVGAAAVMYQTDHGAWPVSVDILVPHYITNLEVFKCPLDDITVDGCNFDLESSYEFVGGEGKVIVREKKFLHNGKRHVVSTDGEVAWESNLEK